LATVKVRWVTGAVSAPNQDPLAVADPTRRSNGSQWLETLLRRTRATVGVLASRT